MRRAASLLALVTLLGVGLAGCTPDPVDKVNPPISVFLLDEVTEQQKQAIEAKLRAVPESAEVVFESREEAYVRFKELFKDDQELVDSVRPDTLPESFKLTMRDRDAFDRLIAGPLVAELREMPGVEEVVYPTGSPAPKRPRADCLLTDPLAGTPYQTDSQDIRVFLAQEITESEKAAILAKLRDALPGGPEVRLETREQAAERFREQFKSEPELLASAKPELLPESFWVRLTDPATIASVADSGLGTELCGLPGVEQVAIPSKVQR